MGAGSYKKDGFIDLYISTNKQYYIPGEYVEGEVYLNAKTTRKYSNLCIKLQGIEHVFWTTGSGKNRRTHSNTYKNYNQHLLLIDFHGTCNQGQYLVPFSLLLPIMMSGSFFSSQNCYIKYILRLQLVHQTQQNQTQIYQMHLNILQPPRMPLGALTIKNTVNSQCCGCCKDYGMTTVQLNCSHNFIYNGDNIMLTGVIDNTGGKSIIDNWRICLQERRIMISAGGRVRDNVDQSYTLVSSAAPVPAGGTKELNYPVPIPQSIVNYTAIGRVTARYYLIVFTSQYGCCANTVWAGLHVILHSRTPRIVLKNQLPPPPNWSPQVFPKANWNTMKPFIYNPLPQIQYLNMPGSQNVMYNPNNPYQANQYQYSQQPSLPIPQDFAPTKFEQDTANYHPVYYDTNLFPQAQQQWQGYKGYQPYFQGENSENSLVRKL